MCEVLDSCTETLVSVPTSNITSKKCGRKMSHLQYEGHELCTLTALLKIQRYFRRTPANGPPNKARNVHVLLDGRSGNRFKQLQCSGLIKALEELSTFDMTLSLYILLAIGDSMADVRQHSVPRAQE